jgi:multidrug efflux pump subunit AcrA (membrane-fusion protein)
MFIFALLISHSIHAATGVPTVMVKPAKLQEVSQVLSYPAVVDAKVRATVLAEMDGVVRKIHANIGQKVRSGTRLFTMQQTDPVYQFAPVSTISPVTGLVSEMAVTEGTLVAKGQKLAAVTDPRTLKIMIEVAAADIALLQNEGGATLEVPALGAPLQLKLIGISPSVDYATGTATAELAPKPADVAKLRPGMVGKVTFKAGLHKGFMIPEDALVQTQNRTFVRVVEDGKAKKVPVTVGARMRGQAEITQGLKEGTMVVERASGFVADGEEVKSEEIKDGAAE